MKAKRLTALALAALMAASTTSVAFAGEGTDYDLDFANDGYYKYNPDTNRIESVDRRYDFQPGDDIYLRLLEDTSEEKFNRKKTYNAYADWAIGDSWVKDIDVVYRKGDITTSTSTTYDWTFNGTGILTGWTASGKGLASQDNATVKAALKGDTVKRQQYIDKYIADNYDLIPASDNAWTDNQGRYWKNEQSAKDNNGITGDINTWSIEGDPDQYNSKEELIAGESLKLIQPSDFIYNNQSVHKTLSDLVKSLSGQAITQIWIKDSSTFGKDDFKEVSGEDGYDKEIAAYVFEIAGQKYFVKSDAVESITYENLTTDMGIGVIEKGDTHASDYFNSQNGAFVANAKINHIQKSVNDQMTEKGIKQVSDDKYLNKGAAEGAKFVTEDVVKTAGNAVDSAIDSADSAIRWKSNTVTNTEPRFEYWVKITTKDSATTKDIDVVGNIWVGTSKSSAKKEADGSEDRFNADFTLTNSNPEMDDEYSDYVTIEDGQPAVVKFADDASDEFEVEFGDDARFVFNARGQGKLNLAYNTKFNKEFAYDYDSANIDFITFEGEPTTNRTGTLYIYADEDSYIYEVTSKGAKKINGAYYDDDEEAWVIRTRHLTSYAISDKKLKTVDQMDNGSSSGSNNSGSNSGNNNNNGKPNPDTGR